MILEIVFKEATHDCWLFSSENSDQALSLKEVVKPFQCHSCPKFPEEHAISRIGPDLAFETTKSCKAFITHDDWFIVGREISESIRQYTNCKTVPVNKPETWFALLPEQYPVDIKVSGFEYSGVRCKSCGRWEEAVVGPLVGSIAMPEKHDLFWTSDVHNESAKGARPRLWCKKSDKKKMYSLFDNSVKFDEAW
ncbi:hypothetical protein [Ketobacter sp.]|uniref:hypothetical protein n=1 Tax=Ketobacter sp. TaxID=2083498 RepID=UPI0025BFC8B4|nr:hypothetical protein [Ketobacter sp.]